MGRVSSSWLSSLGMGVSGLKVGDKAAAAGTKTIQL
jgi:hypothetical protein